MREAKYAANASQGGTLVVGAQDLFLASRVVRCAGGILDKGTTAGAATITLLAFPGTSVSNDVGATAGASIGDLSYLVFHHGR